MIIISILIPGWLTIVLGAIAFIALVWGGYKLSKWLFKKFLPDLFHDGEKRWNDTPKQ